MPDPLDFPCFRCGARVGEYCRGLPAGRSHGSRMRARPIKRRKGSKRASSVRAIPTHFESDRAKH